MEAFCNMWESPIYKFEEETADESGKLIKKPFLINVTYSPPRNQNDPGKALIGVFNKIMRNLDKNEIKILDVGAGKLRNTLWLLQKGFHVWAVEFPGLKDRLTDAKEKWDSAETYPNFHKVTFPKDFINLNEKFDIILLVNMINVMPIPIERFALLSLCREKIKENGMLLWHNWRAKSIHPDSYTEDNEFIDGYLMGQGPNHTFYCEYGRDESHEILYSIGLSFNRTMNLHKVPANKGYSYIFNPTHNNLIVNTLDLNTRTKTTHNPDKVIDNVDTITILDLYIKELQTIPVGRDVNYRYKDAHKYHLLSSRIFFEIFNNQLKEPIIEQEINEGRGRIDIVYKNRNKDGVFKNLKDLRDISCPEVMVECKNYKNNLSNTEYAQLNDRLIPHRGMLGFLLCRDKQDPEKVIKHCHDRYKGGNNKYIIVLDDKDLIHLSELKLQEEDDDSINDFIDSKIKEIIG